VIVISRIYGFWYIRHGNRIQSHGLRDILALNEKQLQAETFPQLDTDFSRMENRSRRRRPQASIPQQETTRNSTFRGVA